MDSTRRITRIIRDLKYIEERPDEFRGIFLMGPPGTPYEGGLFSLKIVVPSNYPEGPLEVRFTTTIFHPNISDASGSLCMDLLDEKWSPGMTLGLILVSIRGLLENPNADSPLNVIAARMIRTDMAMYHDTALMWTSHFAAGTNSTPRFDDEIVMVIAGKGISRTRAIKLLTRHFWDVISHGEFVKVENIILSLIVNESGF